MSNPIASETEPECATDGCDGTPRYCMLCHVGIPPSARSEPTSDPSGKGVETAKEWLTAYLSQFPECVGSPECDGYLAGEEHEKGCPCFGSVRFRHPAIHEVLDAYAASLRQQLSELNEKLALREKCSMAIMRDCPTHGESEQLKSLRTELTEAQGKVSQLEAELARFKEMNVRYAEKRDCSSTFDGVRCGWKFTHDKDTRHRAWTGTGWLLWDECHSDSAKLTSQVSVLTKERDDSREGHRITGDCLKESITRYELAEFRLSAVSEVVSALKIALIPLAALVVSGECVAATTALSEELKTAIIEAHDASLTALTNYEKAQQKEGQ